MTQEQEKSIQRTKGVTNHSCNGTGAAPANVAATGKIDTRTTICPDILACIGQTPLVQLNQIPQKN